MNPSQTPVPSFNLPEPVDEQAATSSATGQDLQAPVPSVQSHPTQGLGDELGADWTHAVETAIRQGIEDPRALSNSLQDIRAQYISGRFAKEIKKQTGNNS
jgi:hypothetical protein